MEVGGVDGFHAMIMALALIGDMAGLDGLTFLGRRGPVTVPEEGMLVISYREPTDTSVLEGTT